jgi:hypothetical protein
MNRFRIHVMVNEKPSRLLWQRRSMGSALVRGRVDEHCPTSFSPRRERRCSSSVAVGHWPETGLTPWL